MHLSFSFKIDTHEWVLVGIEVQIKSGDNAGLIGEVRGTDGGGGVRVYIYGMSIYVSVFLKLVFKSEMF